MLKEFTFVVCTYNQEHYILMHLESIKYQISKYMNKDDIFLIIADDGSTDATEELSLKWVHRNKNLFRKVEYIGDGVNRGLAKNYARIFKYIKTNYYFLLAGDDLYGYKDIKKYVANIETYDVVSSPCIPFFECENGSYQIDLVYKQFKSNIAIGCTESYFMKRAFTIVGCVSEAPSTVYRKELLKEEILEYIESFNMIEDQPTMYRLFRENIISMKYICDSYILYRVNPDSISHTRNPIVKNKVKNDLERLCDNYWNNENNLLYKYLIFLRKLIVTKNKKWINFLLPTNHYLVLVQKMHKRRLKSIYTKALVEEKEKSIEYLKRLKESVDDFLNDLQ